MERLLRTAVPRLKRSLPTVLSFIGALGVVGTAVMAVKATPKALRLLENAKKENGGGLTRLETAQVAAPAYIPAGIVGLSTIACIFGANVLNKRAQASLASAYGLLSQAFRRYQDSAKAVYGDDADAKIKAEAAKAVYVSTGAGLLYSEEYDTESDKVLCYDMLSERYFSATMASLLNAQYHFNRNLQLRGSMTANEFYGFLGIDAIPAFNEVGWSLDHIMELGYMWFDFNNTRVTMDDGLECVVIDYAFTPNVLNDV